METIEVAERPVSFGNLRLLWQHRYFWRFLSLIMAFGAWELFGTFGSNPAVPSFSSTVHALFSMIFDGSLPTAYAETLKPLLLGLFLAASVGIVIGIAMGLSRTGVRKWKETIKQFY